MSDTKQKPRPKYFDYLDRMRAKDLEDKKNKTNGTRKYKT